jgi:chromosome segregation ATPase
MANRNTNVKEEANAVYSYYSRLLNEPFDSIKDLQDAEEAYRTKQKAKEDAVAQKKADAQKVDAAFKNLNAARKSFKEDLTQLTKEYAESLENLKNAFELGKKDIRNKLANAEEDYQTALKEFTDKYENYHVTLKDGDFETTLSKQTSNNADASYNIFDLIDKFFNW